MSVWILRSNLCYTFDRASGRLERGCKKKKWTQLTQVKQKTMVERPKIIKRLSHMVRPKCRHISNDMSCNEYWYIAWHHWYAMQRICDRVDLRKGNCSLLFIDEHLSQSLKHGFLKCEEGAVWHAESWHQHHHLSIQMQTSCNRSQHSQNSIIYVCTFSFVHSLTHPFINLFICLFLFTSKYLLQGPPAK